MPFHSYRLMVISSHSSEEINSNNYYIENQNLYHTQWRIKDFPGGGGTNSQSGCVLQFFAENSMIMKEV